MDFIVFISAFAFVLCPSASECALENAAEYKYFIHLSKEKYVQRTDTHFIVQLKMHYQPSGAVVSSYLRGILRVAALGLAASCLNSPFSSFGH